MTTGIYVIPHFIFTMSVLHSSDIRHSFTKLWESAILGKFTKSVWAWKARISSSLLEIKEWNRQTNLITLSGRVTATVHR